MEIKINDKNVELNFGVAFVRELDKVAGMRSMAKALALV